MSERDRLRVAYDAYERDTRRMRRWSGSLPGNQLMITERSGVIEEAARRAALDDLPLARVLDLGCGSGTNLPWVAGLGFGDAVGVDIRPDALRAASRHHDTVSFACAEGAALPFPDRSFSTVVLFTVLSSVSGRRARREIAEEVDRVLVERGVVAWYDMRARSYNRQVAPVGRRELGDLFPGYAQHVRSVTSLPPLARVVRRPSVYRAIGAFGALRTHYAGILVKPGAHGRR